MSTAESAVESIWLEQEAATCAVSAHDMRQEVLHSMQKQHRQHPSVLRLPQQQHHHQQRQQERQQQRQRSPEQHHLAQTPSQEPSRSPPRPPLPPPQPQTQPPPQPAPVSQERMRQARMRTPHPQQHGSDQQQRQHQQQQPSIMKRARPATCMYCHSQAAVLFCCSDEAALCRLCDGIVHSANDIVARHARWPLCDKCGAKPATMYCEGERAALCKQCDQEYHKSNPTLASHARLPIDPITGGDSSGGGRDSPLFAGDAYYAAVPPPSLPQGHGRSEHMQLARQASLTGLDGLYQVAAQPDAVTGDTTLDTAFDYAANADIDILGASGTLDDALLLFGEAPLVDQSKRQASEFHDWLEALIEESQAPAGQFSQSAHIAGLAGSMSGNFDYASQRTKWAAGSAGSGGHLAGDDASRMWHLARSGQTVGGNAQITEPSTGGAARQSTTTRGAGAPYGTAKEAHDPGSQLPSLHATQQFDAYRRPRAESVARFREKRRQQQSYGTTIRYASRKVYADSRPRGRGKLAKTEENAQGCPPSSDDTQGGSAGAQPRISE